VVEFYKALDRKEARVFAQTRFPALVLDFPDAEIMEPDRNYSYLNPGNPFEKVPEKVFSEKSLVPVTCYHCNKKGHLAWACQSGESAPNQLI
jgi:hypothetical protein